MQNIELTKIITLKVETKNILLRKLFINEAFPDNNELEDIKVNSSIFQNIGFLETKFKFDNLERNIFEECYFRKAQFQLTSLQGSKFKSCNFSQAKFENCNLEYVLFENCAIDFNNIKSSLPEKLNLRKNLCKNLAMEHLKLGNTKEYKKFFFEEREVSRKFHLEKFIFKSEYIKQKYNLEDALTGFFSYLLITFDKLLWGYGEKVTIVLKNIIILNIIFYVWFILIFRNSQINDVKDLVLNFFNFTSFNSTRIPWAVIFHKLLGLIFTGLLITTLFRRINKR